MSPPGSTFPSAASAGHASYPGTSRRHTRIRPKPPSRLLRTQRCSPQHFLFEQVCPPDEFDGTMVDSVNSNRARPIDVVHQLADVSDLVLVYCVPYTGIDTLRDDCIHRGEHLARLVDPAERNMRIDIAAADEDRCVRQRALIVASQSWGTDQAGT